MTDHVYKVMKFTQKVIKELEEPVEHGQGSDSMFKPTKARCLGLGKGRHLRLEGCQWQQRVPFTHKGHLCLHLTSPITPTGSYPCSSRPKGFQPPCCLPRRPEKAESWFQKLRTSREDDIGGWGSTQRRSSRSVSVDGAVRGPWPGRGGLHCNLHRRSPRTAASFSG